MQADKNTPNVGVDFPDLLARVEYDRDLLREVFGIFVEDYPQLLKQLKDAVLRAEMDRIRIAAHTLKGMLASLSFRAASASAMRIEKLAIANCHQEIVEELVRLELQTALASSHLQEMCGEVIR
jgi:HPt (histidine-containing phosphotransfer) domain-containing protein